MRLWTMHPSHLDARGLVALWREALLAQAVLRGETSGYRSHPQLSRFQAQTSPTACIAEYLKAVYAESVERGYRFNASKIAQERTSGLIEVTHGQLAFEWQHLMAKLATRAPELHAQQHELTPRIHPLFKTISGDIETWEHP